MILYCDACANDSAMVDTLTSAYDAELGEDSYYILEEPMKFSDDFSFFSTVTGKPSVMMFLNAGHAEGHEKGILHNETCTFDESVMQHGVAAMSLGALSMVK